MEPNARNILLVYGVIKADNPPLPESPPGINQKPVEEITVHGFTAVISRLPKGLYSFSQPETAHIIDYGKVIAALHEQTDIIPMRYGCLFETEENVCKMLEENRRRYLELLNRISDCTEYGVRIILPPEQIAPCSQPQSSKEIAQLNGNPNGRNYLLARKSYYATQSQASEMEITVRERFQKVFHGLFSDIAWESTLKNQVHLLSLYFLVPKNKVQFFQHAFRAMAPKDPLKMMLTGPWPPYNFMQERDESHGNE